MSNYALDSPVNRKMYVPGEDDINFAPVVNQTTSEVDQTHRQMKWLHHKPQNHAIFPQPPIAVKTQKKKPSEK
ncbi:MAG: hypothetical protein WCR08_14130 [Gammaproteobacteria bacterium]